MSKPKVAILLSRYPYPLEKGDKLRAYHQIRLLSHYFDIHLYTFSFHEISDITALSPYVVSQRVFQLRKITSFFRVVKHFFSDRPIQNGIYYSPALKKKICLEWERLNPAIVYVQLPRIADYADDIPFPNCIDLQDAFSLNYYRSSKVVPWYIAWVYQIESKRIAQYEKEIIKRYKHTFIISDQDKQAIGEAGVNVVSNGVDYEYFSTSKQSQTYDLVFTGNLGYLPNQLAVQWIVNELLPLLPPHLKILIAGASPSASILKLASEQVTILSWLPDIRSAYQSSKIFIAPLFTGAGMQNKVLEAMSSGLPCVVTPIVNKAIKAKTTSEVLVASDPHQFAAQITLLLNDDEMRVNMGMAARRFIVENYSWETATHPLIETFISISNRI